MSVTAGGNHTCAPVTSGGARCWGANGSGQLGDNSLENRTTPVNALITVSRSYTVYDTDHKHAVKLVEDSDHLTIFSGTYDANGNMITRVEEGKTYTQVFDAENRLVSVTVNNETTQFVYDGDGNLVKQIQPDGICTIYIGGVYEVEKATCGSLTVTKTTTYYLVAGAMRIDNDVYYVLKDHLGSASVVTDSDGIGNIVVGEQRYYPFGGTRWSTGSLYTDKLFTGQREMEGLGIYHYGARFYSPTLGRFLSPDSIIPGAANPQNLNRYSYVLNNPLRYVDPTGHAWDDCKKLDSDVACKSRMQRVNKIKAGWAAEDAKLRRGSAGDLARAHLGGKGVYAPLFDDIILFRGTCTGSMSDHLSCSWLEQYQLDNDPNSVNTQIYLEFAKMLHHIGDPIAPYSEAGADLVGLFTPWFFGILSFFDGLVDDAAEKHRDEFIYNVRNWADSTPGHMITVGYQFDYRVNTVKPPPYSNWGSPLPPPGMTTATGTLTVCGQSPNGCQSLTLQGNEALQVYDWFNVHYGADHVP